MTKKKYLIHINSGPSAQCSVVSSMQRRQLNATLSARCKAVNAGPLAQCRAVSSVQRRQLSAAPSAVNEAPSAHCRAVRGRLFQCRGRLFQCRAVSSMQGGLSAQHRNCSKQGITSMQCRAVCSMQGPSAQCGARLLNATGARLLNARPSARCKAVARPSAQGRTVSSVQGCSFQCRAVCFNAGLTQCKTITSMQGHQLNAGPTPQCMGVWLA